MTSAVLRMTTNVVALEVMIHYDFKEPLLAWEALQLPGNGVSEIGSRQLPDGNKRLAILGDHALDLVLCSEWHKSEMSKGRWSKIRVDVSSNSSLHRTGVLFNIGSVLQGNPTNPQPISNVMMATAVEAVIGAVFRDGGLTAVERVMETLGLTIAAAALVTLKPFLPYD
ncbi:hypothetical protein MMC34_005577 [Xylographa carneopallida]|nr:hypothetical protein [Xylographa carneopallida]